MFCSLQSRSNIRNRILTSLPWTDFEPLRALLEPVSLKDRSVLHEPNRRIEYVNFVETGLVSLVTLASETMLETATVGRHGIVGASIVLGARASMHKAVVSMPGRALRIAAEDLQRSMIDRPQIREHFLRYVQSLMVHCSQTALCGIRHELEPRLACWICLACDAIDGETLPVTHDYLSFILGLRRAGVTEALNRFEELGLVRKARGVLHVSDRGSLERKACCCYGAITAAYDWLTPHPSLYASGRAMTRADEGAAR